MSADYATVEIVHIWKSYAEKQKRVPIFWNVVYGMSRIVWHYIYFYCIAYVLYHISEIVWFIVDAGSQPEELNKKAVAIINRVRDKLTGICGVNFLQETDC